MKSVSKIVSISFSKQSLTIVYTSKKTQIRRSKYVISVSLSTIEKIITSPMLTIQNDLFTLEFPY